MLTNERTNKQTQTQTNKHRHKQQQTRRITIAPGRGNNNAVEWHKITDNQSNTPHNTHTVRRLEMVKASLKGASDFSLQSQKHNSAPGSYDEYRTAPNGSRPLAHTK